MNPTISACIIAKNEENNIYDCIKSVVNIVDEIIVLDTGSTDKTIEIAKQFHKVKVYQTLWEDDFSKARNECISYAKGDWILSMDCDEYLEYQYDIKQFIKNNLFKDNKILCFNIVSLNPFSFNKAFFRAKMFKNNGMFIYVKPIHEFPYTNSIHNHVLCKDINIIHNNGSNKIDLIKKNNKYIHILKKIIQKTCDKNDLSYYHKHIANSYLEIDNIQQAINHYKTALILVDDLKHQFAISLIKQIKILENNILGFST